jgi:hypothetical protein
VHKLVFLLCFLAAAAAAFLAYAAVNFSHGPDIAIPIAGIAVVNAIMAFAAWARRPWSTWILFAGASMELFVVYYLLSEALYLGKLNGLDYVVKLDLLMSALLLIKIGLEIRLGARNWKTR